MKLGFDGAFAVDTDGCGVGLVLQWRNYFESLRKDDRLEISKEDSKCP